MKTKITCKACGNKYEIGMPHGMFCKGFKYRKGDKCVTCGNDDETSLKKCRGCGEIICELCEETKTHEC